MSKVGNLARGSPLRKAIFLLARKHNYRVGVGQRLKIVKVFFISKKKFALASPAASGFYVARSSFRAGGGQRLKIG